MTTAEEIVRDEFIKNYAAYKETRALPSSKPDSENLKVCFQLLVYYLILL